MSFDPHIVPQITLLDKTALNKTIISVEGDSALGNLVRHRKEGSYAFAGVRKNRHGSITLRAKDGLFITKEPILTRDIDFSKYLIEVQFFQPTKPGDTGHPNPVGRVGELVRYEISEPVQDADEKGQLLTITLTAIESRARYSTDSETHRLEEHQQSFLRRVNHFNNTNGGGGVTFSASVSTINLPTSARLDWVPGTPTPTHDLWVDIIDSLRRVSLVAGDFDDYYYYFTNDPTLTNTLQIDAEIFGARDATSRGEQEVILTPTRSASTDTFEKKHTVITSNVNFRNVQIVRGANGSHSWPMEYTRFASDWEHAKISADWSSASVEYEVGDFVKFGGQLHKAIVKHTSAIGLEPIPDTSNLWDNLSTLTTHTPLTNNTDLWLANLDAKNEPFVSGTSGGLNNDGFHRGFSVDMNICVTHYDTASSQNPYLSISGKDVEFMLVNDPTTLTAAEIVDGYRGIVGTVPTGAFAGNAERLAEWNEFKSGGAGWEFSDPPVDGDYVNDRSTGRVIAYRNPGSGLQWDTANPSWSLDTTSQNASPFHPVKNITLTDGPDGRPNSAIAWEYDWDVNEVDPQLIRNKASRWAGFSIKMPIPHRVFGSLAVGDIWKNATMDFENMSRNPDGSISDWNRGEGSENLGNLRGVACKLNLDFRDINDNIIDGLANITTVWWFRDKFNRTVFTEAKVRRVSNYVTIQFEAGPDAKMQLHENRVEELYQLAIGDSNFVFPFNDHLLEKEYSGIRFDWNFVKEMGMFYKGSYDNNFFYKNAQNEFLDRAAAVFQQIFQGEAFSVITGKVGNYVISKCTVKLAEFRFIKDAYVSSATGVTADARVTSGGSTSISDYNTLKDIAIGRVRRSEHYPQFTPIDSYVDVRMRLGETFKASGPRWSDEKDPPGNIRTMVCAEYTIFESDNGSRMQTLGYNRFGQF